MAQMIDHGLLVRRHAPGILPPLFPSRLPDDTPLEVGPLAVPDAGAASADGMLDVVTLLNKAAMVLDRRGDVLGMNAEAEALYPVALGKRQGRLFALHRAAEPSFRALLAGAILPVPDPDLSPALMTRLPRRDGGNPLVARAIPLAGVARSGVGQAAAMLLLIDPDRRCSVDPEMLQIAFGLTRAEAHLAGILADGADLFEVASRLRISRSTTRSHLRSIFTKTGTCRQGELVALLARVAC